MITKEKVEMYHRFNGDIDGSVRLGTADRQTDMTDKDWSIIDGFLQDIPMVKNSVASEVFMKFIDERLQEICDSAEKNSYLYLY